MRFTRGAARIEPRTNGTQCTSRSTAHGVQVVQPPDYRGRAGLAHFRSQSCSFTCRDLSPPSNTRFLGPTQDHTRNGISVGSATFAGPWVAILMAPHQRIGRDRQGRTSSYHVAEHSSARFESLQPHTERSS